MKPTVPQEQVPQTQAPGQPAALPRTPVLAHGTSHLQPTGFGVGAQHPSLDPSQVNPNARAQQMTIPFPEHNPALASLGIGWWESLLLTGAMAFLVQLQPKVTNATAKAGLQAAITFIQSLMSGTAVLA